MLSDQRLCVVATFTSTDFNKYGIHHFAFPRPISAEHESVVFFAEINFPAVIRQQITPECSWSIPLNVADIHIGGKLRGKIKSVFLGLYHGFSFCTLRSSSDFYGQPLASSLRTILERRKAHGLGPASVNDLFDVLSQGGFQFQTKNDENAKRGVYGALSKNAVTFHKLPNGDYGLTEWYPNVREARDAKSTNGNGGNNGGTAPATEDDDFDMASKEETATKGPEMVQAEAAAAAKKTAAMK